MKLVKSLFFLIIAIILLLVACAHWRAAVLTPGLGNVPAIVFYCFFGMLFLLLAKVEKNKYNNRPIKRI